MRTMIRSVSFSFGFVILFTALLHAPSALAQTASASISGRITDQTNAVVPDVEVEIKNVDTGVTQVTKTNHDGFYSLPTLSPGNYLINVRKQQFQTDWIFLQGRSRSARASYCSQAGPSFAIRR